MSRINLKICILISLFLLTNCGGGGSGGGGSNSTTYTVPTCSDTGTAYQTTEYYWMDYSDRTDQALARVCASTAYANGATGAGVKVAVLDTGLSLYSNGKNKHREFGSNYGSLPSSKIVLVDGADAANHTANYDDDIPEDNHGHGTHVASTIGAIKDGVGMHGVAYDSILYPIKMMDPYGSFWNSSAWGAYRATINNVDIVNNSWTMGGQVGVSCNSDASCESYIKAREEDPSAQTYEYVKYIATYGGIISVWAAGNDGYSNPAALNGSCIYNTIWKELCVIVVAIDTDGKIASFSNKCGIAADYCIAAPGTDIYAATIGSTNSYSKKQGTSMAAPMVSGGLALVKEKFSSLTNQQVIDRLFAAAVDHQEYSQSSIYGHGLMDLGAATSNIEPVQVLNISPSLNLDDKNSIYSELSSNSITASVAINAALNNSLQGKTMEVYDSFDRANFEVNISSFLNNDHLLNKYSITNHLSNLSLAGDDLILKESNSGTLISNANGDIKKSLFISSNNKLVIANNTSSNNFFLDTKRNLNLNSQDVDYNYFDNPYFFKTNSDFALNYNLGATSAEIFSGIEGENIGLSFNYLLLSHRAKQYNKLGDLELSLGVVLEDSKLLNSYSMGVFSLGENSSTVFTGIKYKKNIEDFDLFANIYYGDTQVVQNNNSYINITDSIITNSYAAGLIKNNFFDRNKKIAFLVYQPQKVIDGNIILRVPISSNRDRNVTLGEYDVNLESLDTQTNYDLYFIKEINKKNTFILNISHIKNPNHDGNAKSQNNLSFIFKKLF